MPNVFTTCTFETIYQVDSACLWSILCFSQCILSHLLSDNLSCDKGVLFFLERTELTIDRIHSTYSFQTCQVHHFMINFTKLSKTILSYSSVLYTHRTAESKFDLFRTMTMSEPSRISYKKRQRKIRYSNLFKPMLAICEQYMNIRVVAHS